MATLLRLDGGTLHVAGIDALRRPAQVRQVIGLAGQFAAVEPAMTGPAGGAQRAAGRTADQGGQQGADGANRLRSTAPAMRRRGRTRPRKRSRHRMGTQVVNNPDQYRYEIYVDDTLAGFAQYHRQSGVVTFTHTEIDPDYEGQGLGSVLARSALDELRGSDEQVVPLCPFIAGYIRRHRQYVDLVVPERRVAFQQPTAGQ